MRRPQRRLSPVALVLVTAGYASLPLALAAAVTLSESTQVVVACGLYSAGLVAALLWLHRPRHRREPLLRPEDVPLCLSCAHPVADHSGTTGCHTVTEHLLCACELVGPDILPDTAGISRVTQAYGFDYERRPHRVERHRGY